jgi:predicted MFS family arabinose efflux permease
MSEVSSGAIVDPAKYRGKVLAISILGYAFDGMDIMVFALAAPLLLGVWPGLTIVQLGIVATCMLLGMSFGGYIFGPIADKIGRKRALVWCIAFFGVTTGLAGFCQNYIQLSALRFLAGLGLGAEWALAGTLLQEFTEPAKRAKIGSYMMFGWPIGYGITILISYFLTPKFGWPILYFAGASAVFLAIYIQFAIPESPMWLKMHQDKKRGIAAGAPVAAVGFSDLLKKDNIKSFIWVVVLCTSMMITYWSVNTFLPTVLARERGLSPKAYSSFLMVLQFLAAIAYVVGGICATKFSKRSSMAVFAFLSAVTFFGWLAFDWDDNIFFLWGGCNWMVASAIWAILAAYLVEQFPTNIRAIGVAAGFSSGRLIATVVPLAMGAAAAQIGLTAVMTAISIFYLVAMVAVLMLKESKGHM